MNDVIDFDKMFEEYAMEWFKENGGEYSSDEQVEEIMPEVYEQWASSPSHKLGGIAPRAFFDGIESADELIAILIGTSEGDNNPCSLLLDRITEVQGCAEKLKELLSKPKLSDKLKLICMQLLKETGSSHPLDTYILWITDGSTDEDVRESAIEVLKDNADAVTEKLFAALENADDPVRTVIAEILVHAKKDERTFALLTDLFSRGDNIPLYAQYLGEYGDERAAAILYRALDTCDYAEFMEIKNAIERLGGTVDDDYRDFSDDPAYIAVKGLK